MAGITLALLVALALPLGLPTTTRAAVTITNLTGGAFVPLDFLTGGNQALVGDKLFSNFTFIKSGDFPVSFGADDLNVIGIQDFSGNFGIRYQGAISPNLGGTGDVLLTYTVQVLAPNTFISDLHLGYNGGQISAVYEDALVNGITVAHIEVTNPPPVFQAVTNISPAQIQVDIIKDISVRSLGGVTQISFIDQSFSQVQIPEPSTVVLVSTSLIGLLAFARRRKS